MTTTVVVFARAPGHGDAKTRMIPALGADLTGRLYRAMLADTLDNARLSGAAVLLAHTGMVDATCRSLADRPIEQRGATFGERFDHALRDAFKIQGGPVVLIGADTPHLGADAIRQAFETLERSDAVIGPSTEGGFYLLGLRERPIEVRSAFDHPNEAAALAAILQAKGSVDLLAPSFDLDVPGDLVELMLRADLDRALGRRCWARSTLEVLESARVAVERSPSGGRARAMVVPADR